MKPMNFPGKVNSRRVTALNYLRNLQKQGKASDVQIKEQAILELKIDNNSRGVRTKKDRRGQARVRI